MGEAPRRLAALLIVPVTAALAGYWALAWLPSVFIDGVVLPAGHDALYHARRILDAIDAPLRVVQFDRMIHAPEGSWVNWPWGYDASMAALAALARAVGIEPMRALAFVPPAFLLANAALLVAIARALRLPPAAQWLVALCFALSPLTQDLHAVGQIDHHFLEYTAVLAALLCGLRWSAAPRRALPAAALGVVLGLANGVHNGLFVLQLPVLGALALWWARGLGPDPRAAAAFAAGLVGATLAVLLPSQPFHLGFVRYDLLSWFHLYAACLTALAVLLGARVAPGWGAAACLGAVLALAALPLVREVLGGLAFMTAAIYADFAMPEMQGPLARGLQGAVADYSGLVLLLPLSLAGALAVAARSRDPALLFLCACALFGGAMLVQQYRFHQFGSFALYVLPLALLCARFPEGAARRRVLGASAAVALLAYAPCLERLRALPAPGGSPDFAVTASLYPALAQACRARPGIVLADHNDGHHVRLLSDCAVVANNLVLGPESFAKLHESRRLLDAAPDALRAAAPWVRYVLVRRDDDVFAASSPDDVRRRNSALRRALLLDAPPWPPGYRLLGELRLGPEPGAAVIARLFEIQPL